MTTQNKGSRQQKKIQTAQNVFSIEDIHNAPESDQNGFTAIAK